MSFRQRVYDLVCRIPPGCVLGYGHVAAAIGSPGAARQVGWAMAALSEGGRDGSGRAVPWHRVLRSSGHIAFQGDPLRGTRQRQLLLDEGVRFRGEAVDMQVHRWEVVLD